MATVSALLEHLLVTCPALSQTRKRLYQMWLDHTVMFPSLHANIRELLESPVDIIVQFVLCAHYHLYLTRTFAFNMYREYHRFIKTLNDPTLHQVLSQLRTNLFYLSVVRCYSLSLKILASSIFKVIGKLFH